MNAKVKSIDTTGYERIIAISDVHGNAALLARLLEKIDFSERDALFLLGDYIEKGTDSLNTLRYVMELSKRSNVFALMGNCDTLYIDVQKERYHRDILQYMLRFRRTVLMEMCSEQGYPVNERTDKEEMRAMLLEKYAAEFTWLSELPHILKTKDMLFVHAGLEDKPLSRQTPEGCMKRDAFGESAASFEKYVVVGHWPVVNYSTGTHCVLSHLPVVDELRHVVSIDGGLGIKASGQLNALIVQEGEFSAAYVDELPKATVLRAQTGSQEAHSVVWAHNEVDALEAQGDGTYTLCRVKCSGALLRVPNELLYQEQDGTMHSADYTDYILPLREGDEVGVAQERNGRYLVKYNGVLGWADRSRFTPR